MIDFLRISTKSPKKGEIDIYPKFIIGKSNDLMIRGGDFYAIWNEELGLWSTDEQDVIRIIDRELDKYAEENRQRFDDMQVRVLHMWDSDTGMIDKWHKYCQKQLRDSFHTLDECLLFANSKINKKDYASKRLPYPLEKGEIKSYDKLISTLYSEEERHKIEWSIGSIVSGDSKKIQKFVVLYGSAGTGKSTILNVIQMLFDGYYSVFDAKALGSASNSFALEAFKSNPLVAIQHDGDLSRIEDNTRINSLVSHEMMTVNEKFKSTYSNRFKCFLFMGTNKPVKITDAKSGLIRRLIDVSPSGKKVKQSEYETIMNHINFELGAIANHCLEVYKADPRYYDNYIPLSMIDATNDFYNFMVDSYHIFLKDNGVTLKAAWEMYKLYCEDAKVLYPYSKRLFKEELKDYFKDFNERAEDEAGTRVRNYYSGFRTDRFEISEKKTEKVEKPKLIEFDCSESIFDKECSDCLAQYASENGTPVKKWEKVKTTLEAINTSKLHYVKLHENHIVVDFDIPDENGEKSFEKNLEAASKWPPTYAELSKSGAGIHLHYIYTGDITKLSRVFDDHIEIKVFTGNSSLRRKLTKCNSLPIATINSGLPLKGDDKMLNFDSVRSENGLRALIKRNLNKEIHPGTKPSIDFIYKILEDAYASDLKYDVSDLENAVIAFAASSTHQADYCLALTEDMKFHSEDLSSKASDNDGEIVFFDCEVFPNLFLVNYKAQGEGKPVVRLINPKPAEIEELFKFRLIGFNCRRYDNHMLYARFLGYSNQDLYNLSQRIVSGDGNAFFGQAYNISYTDVYDFAAQKQSLKKWEIELGIHHQELGLPWDQPVPEELWIKVAEYCDNDVLATEAVFNHLTGDFVARKILAILADKTVNDTTNQLTTRIIFGSEKKPQAQFNYRDMGAIPEDEAVYAYDFETKKLREYREGDYTVFDEQMRPIFPGYKYENGVSTYRGEEIGEGGYVYAEAGIYVLTPVDDIASMHPSSIEAEQLFGEYTKNFSAIKLIRVEIKHGNFERAKEILLDLLENLYGDDKARSIISELSEYLTEEYADALAYALKIAINSVYGLTSAKFDNPFRDIRNKDNIVAKRGALFMVNLKHEVWKRGFTVAHIKTDSIKIPNATPEILEFVYEYGQLYGYTFEHESTYEKMCLVNDAVYVAKYATKEKCEKLYGYVPGDNKKHGGEWTATGTQFQVPYVFKTLFSKEPIEFDDMCETMSTTTSLYLDMNESLPDVSEKEKELTKYIKKYPDDIVHVEELKNEIAKGHSYHFIGKVGQFCPVQTGSGGGVLYREKDGKYYSVGGSKGYRWLESEMVKNLKKEYTIDKSYYKQLVDKAVDAISKYGDFEWFASDDESELTKKNMDFMNIPEDAGDELPFN